MCAWLTTRDAALVYTPPGSDPAPGANLFVGVLPTVPPAKLPSGYIAPAATVAAFRVYGGAAPTGTLDDPLTMEQPRFQVVVRGAPYALAGAEVFAYRLWGILGRVRNQAIGDVWVPGITAVQSPVALEQGADGRWIVAANYAALKEV